MGATRIEGVSAVANPSIIVLLLRLLSQRNLIPTSTAVNSHPHSGPLYAQAHYPQCQLIAWAWDSMWQALLVDRGGPVRDRAAAANSDVMATDVYLHYDSACVV